MAVSTSCSTETTAQDPKDCVRRAEAAVALNASSDTSDWRQELREFADSHDPDHVASLVVKPNTAPLRHAIEEIGGRVTHEFGSFNGMLVRIEVRHIPELLEIEGIDWVSTGATGAFQALPPCPDDTDG